MDRDREPRRRPWVTLLLVVMSAATVFLLWSWTKPDAPRARPKASLEEEEPLRGEPPPRDDETLPAPSVVAQPSAAPSSSSSPALLVATWGSGPKQVGRTRPSEGNPEGPMSLATDGRGRVFILDQVNARLAILSPDGTPETTVPIRSRAAQDLAVAKDGSTAVLDRLGDKQIELHGPDGKFRGTLPLQGEGVEQPGLVTGVFVDGDDVYVEREHGPLVLVGTVDGKPASPRTEIPGRPSRDGRSFLTAGITDAASGRIYVASIDRATKAHRFTREIRLGTEAPSIDLLDTDASGTIYLAVTVERGEDEAVDLLCLEPAHGAPFGSVELPATSLPEETFRSFAVQDDGGVVYALLGESGVTYRKYDCRLFDKRLRLCSRLEVPRDHALSIALCWFFPDVDRVRLRRRDERGRRHERRRGSAIGKR